MFRFKEAVLITRFEKSFQLAYLTYIQKKTSFFFILMKSITHDINVQFNVGVKVSGMTKLFTIKGLHTVICLCSLPPSHLAYVSNTSIEVMKLD